jgi:5-methylcytosine-specific restriction endonuclease McrA
MKTQECFTSKVCTICNIEKEVSIFYVRNGYVQKYCLECKRAKNRKHYQENPEAYKQRAKNWADANPDKRKEIVNSYDSRNRETIREYHSNRKVEVNEARRVKYMNDAEMIRAKVTAWYHNNKHRPEIKAERARLCAERQRKLKEIIPKDTDINAIKEIYKQCQLKNIETGVKHNVDHIIPISKGGKHCATNLQILTAFENQSKGAKLI